MHTVKEFSFPHEADPFIRYLSTRGINTTLVEGSQIFHGAWEPRFQLIAESESESQKAKEILTDWDPESENT